MYINAYTCLIHILVKYLIIRYKSKKKKENKALLCYSAFDKAVTVDYSQARLVLGTATILNYPMFFFSLKFNSKVLVVCNQSAYTSVSHRL